MSMSLSCEDSVDTSVFESDQKMTKVNPKDTASESAALTAKASAIRAGPTWLRFENMDHVDPVIGSLKIQPKHLLFVAEIQAASTKHCVCLSKGVGMDNLGQVLFCRR